EDGGNFGLTQYGFGFHLDSPVFVFQLFIRRRTGLAVRSHWWKFALRGFHPTPASVLFPSQEGKRRSLLRRYPTASSTVSIQCRPGVRPAPSRWVWQPMLAVTMTSGLPLSSAVSLLSRSCLESAGWVIE